MITPSGIVSKVAVPPSDTEMPSESVGTKPGVSGEMPGGNNTSVVGTMKGADCAVVKVSSCGSNVTGVNPVKYSFDSSVTGAAVIV